MNYKKKIIVFLLAMVLILSVTSCKDSTKDTASDEPSAAKTSEAVKETAEAEPTEEPGIDISEKVNLEYWMVGDAAKDYQVIGGMLSEMAEEDLNCTVTFNFTTWSDANQKYDILLSSGQQVDLIYTGTWMDFWKYAKAGAFQSLDELLPEYAPDLYAYVGDENFNRVKVNGSIYTIPSIWPEYINGGVSYRKDLQEKYNLPEPNSLENLEAYMAGVKENMPEQKIVGESMQIGRTNAMFAAMECLMLKYKWASVTSGLSYGFAFEWDNPTVVTNYWESSDFVDDMKMFKKWADMGFWSRSVLSEKSDGFELFRSGVTVVGIDGQNPQTYSGHILAFQTNHPDWEVGFYPYAYNNGIANMVHPAQNGTAVPLASENPGRALMFLEKLTLDKTYNQLAEYGVEGTHYNEEDGFYIPIEGSTFTREGLNGWNFRNEEYTLYPKSFAKILELTATYKDITHVNIIDGFAEDFTPYQAERAALSTVLTEYLAPLEAGLVPDVEAAIATFLEKAKEAGLEDVQAAYKAQWDEYVAGLN